MQGWGNYLWDVLEKVREAGTESTEGDWPLDRSSERIEDRELGSKERYVLDLITCI